MDTTRVLLLERGEDASEIFTSIVKSTVPDL